MRYVGLDEILRFKFTTRDATGAPATLSGTPSLAIYPEDSATQITSGISLTVDYDSKTGLNDVAVELSNSDAIYTAGKAYQVVIEAGTVDSVSVVGEVVYEFYLSSFGSLEAAIARIMTALNDAAPGAPEGLVKVGANTGATSFTAGVTLANASGTALTVSSSGSNGAGVAISGNGSGPGVDINAGATGIGLDIDGGSSSGAGLTIDSNSTSGVIVAAGGNGNGAQIIGSGTGAGISISAGSDGNGIDVSSGGSSGDAIALLGTDKGINVIAFVEEGISISTSGTNRNGVLIAGNGSAAGARFNGGATGAGLDINGGTTSGPAVDLDSTSGSAVTVNAGGGNGDAVTLVGQGSGHGIRSTGGATGSGLRAIGGSTSGAAAHFTGTAGNANAITIAGQGSGEGVSITGGATGHSVELIGGSSTGHGLYIRSQSSTNGYGVRIEAGAGGYGVSVLGGSGGTEAVDLTGSSGVPGLRVIGGIFAQGTTYPGISALSSGAPGMRINNSNEEGEVALEVISDYGRGIYVAGAAFGSDADGAAIFGGGSGHGISFTGGATGHGIASTGGFTSGDGVNLVAVNSGNFGLVADGEPVALLSDVLASRTAILSAITDEKVGFIKSQPVPNFTFPMYAADGTPALGLTIDASRRLDTGNFDPCANSVVEIGAGVYAIDLVDSDLNGDIVTLMFNDASTGSDVPATILTIKTES